MSQMHQMQFNYVPVEDRILFRINTTARQEFRFWMTRRYTAILWQAVTDYIRKQQGDDVDPFANLTDSIAEASQAEIKHQEAIADADFQTAYQESSYLPLGDEPKVLFSIGIRTNDQGQTMICLHPQGNEGIEMVINDQIAHSMCQLVIETNRKAKWDLDLVFKKTDSGKGGDRGRPRGGEGDGGGLN